MRLLMAARIPASGSSRNSFSAGEARHRIERRARAVRKHRIEHLRRRAGFLQQHSAQAFGDEIVNLVDHRRPADRLRGGRGSSNSESDPNPAGLRARCAAPPRRRAAGRTDPWRPSAAARWRRCPPACRSCRQAPAAWPVLVRGQRVAGKSRPVVLLERQRQFLRFALRFGVVAPHRALQLRKLADHGGHQVGLGRAPPPAPRSVRRRCGCRSIPPAPSRAASCRRNCPSLV